MHRTQSVPPKYREIHFSCISRCLHRPLCRETSDKRKICERSLTCWTQKKQVTLQKNHNNTHPPVDGADFVNGAIRLMTIYTGVVEEIEQ